MELSQNAINWLANGKRGISSNTMFEVITGIVATRDGDRSHPHDPDDFRRCRLLLDSCPEFKPFIHKLRTESAQWFQLVEHWQTICDTMDEETPEWRAGKGLATKTFKLMQQILSPNQ